MASTNLSPQLTSVVISEGRDIHNIRPPQGMAGRALNIYNLDKTCPLFGKVQDTSKFRRDGLTDLLLDQAL